MMGILDATTLLVTGRFGPCQICPPKSSFFTPAVPSLGFDSGKALRLRRVSPVNGKRNEKVARLNVRALKELTGSVVRGEGLRFAVVAARFNEVITRPLVRGVLETFQRYSVKDEDVTVIWVPGSFEIPLVCQQLAKSGKFEAVVAIGAVIRGATTHYDAVAGSAASGIMSASLNSGVPVIFGVLTTEDMDQAIDRAGGKVGNKGAEAALTAIEMASLFKHCISPLTGDGPLAQP